MQTKPSTKKPAATVPTTPTEPFDLVLYLKQELHSVETVIKHKEKIGSGMARGIAGNLNRVADRLEIGYPTYAEWLTSSDVLGLYRTQTEIAELQDRKKMLEIALREAAENA